MLDILKLNYKSKAGKQHFAYEVKTYAINQRIMIIICTSVSGPLTLVVSLHC